MQTVLTGIGKLSSQACLPLPCAQGRGRLRRPVGRVADLLAKHGHSADADSMPTEMSQLA